MTRLPVVPFRLLAPDEPSQRLTPFGRAFRQIRIDRHWRMMDVAHALGISSADVSAFDTGKKPLPDGYVDQVAQVMGLTAEERATLESAAHAAEKAGSTNQ